MIRLPYPWEKSNSIVQQTKWPGDTPSAVSAAASFSAGKKKNPAEAGFLVDQRRARMAPIKARVAPSN
ncbi:hypothetical protein [Luteibacter sp. UNCMF366Tsu5.1]|uniref:hypothetical protein n=1 Tax=Luteibacter sp. UNCMF366Tsu5.1 TaxID=1502758 RepID=UPI001160888C|nr:hypothetical protein [Luteibacter sp. UNCMF366Tsu5.1]